MRRGRAVSVLLTALIGSACVPTTNDADPRGAVLIELHPSAGALGQPFVTDDGWTVTVEAFVLQIDASASTDAYHKYEDFADAFGKPDTSDVLFSATQSTSLRVDAIPAGPANAVLGYAIHSIPSDEDTMVPFNDPGVDPAFVSRFEQTPDLPFGSFEPPAPPDSSSSSTTTAAAPEPAPVNIGGPSFLLKVHAEKQGRTTIRFDVTVQEGFPSDPLSTSIVPNNVVSLSTTVTPENFFRDEDDRDAPLLFDDYAVADANGDGTLTAAEIIKSQQKPCPGCTDTILALNTLAESIFLRSGNVFVATPTKTAP